MALYKVLHLICNCDKSQRECCNCGQISKQCLDIALDVNTLRITYINENTFVLLRRIRKHKTNL